MLLFESLYDVVIQSLIEYKGSSIQELHICVSKKYQISLPNFYKVISKLIDDQIVIKENGKLSLHSRRILEFLSLADRMKQVYLETDEYRIGTQSGWSKSYNASSIKDLDGVRGDLMFEVNRILGNQESTYVYQAHPYYALGMNETEMSFFKQANKIAPVYFLTGNVGFLDLYGTEFYKKIGVKSLAMDNIPFLKDGYCVTVVGNYIFEVIYPKVISDYFKIFFDSIKDLKDFNAGLFQRVFEMKADCKVTVRYDEAQAKNIVKVFKKVFK